jgi:hypothetical protein
MRGFQEASPFRGFPTILLYNSGMEPVVMQAQSPSRENIP